MRTPEDLLLQTVQSVESILKDKFPDYVAFGDGSFTISHGSATVMIVVRPFTETETVVECTSQVVSGARISVELMQYLLRKNAELHFGAFGLLFDNTINYSYALPGSNLDEQEFYTAVNAVAIIADHYDDEIVAMAGGQRSADEAITDLEA